MPNDTGGDQLPQSLTDNTERNGRINGTDSMLPDYGEDPVDLRANNMGYPVDNVDIPNVMARNGQIDPKNIRVIGLQLFLIKLSKNLLVKIKILMWQMKEIPWCARNSLFVVMCLIPVRLLD